MKKDERIAKAHYADYLKSNNYFLWDVYGRFSRAKERAYDYYRNKMIEMGGRDLRILSANSQSFTLGFEFVDKETGVLKFAYVTKDYFRTCDI